MNFLTFENRHFWTKTQREIEQFSKKFFLIQTPHVLKFSTTYVILWDSLFKMKLFPASYSIRNDCKYCVEVRVSSDGDEQIGSTVGLEAMFGNSFITEIGQISCLILNEKKER